MSDKEGRGTLWFRALLTFFMVGLIAWFFWAHWSDVRALKWVPPGVLAVVALAQAFGVLLHSAAFLPVVRCFGPKVGYFELVALSTGGTVASALLPLGGAVVKAAYLEREHGVAHRDAVSALAYFSLLRVVASAVVAGAGLLLYQTLYEAPNPGLWMIATGAFLMALLPLLVPRWGRFTKPQGVWAPVLLLGMVRTVVGFFSGGVLLLSLIGSGSAFWAGGVAASLALIVELIKVTPGNLGIVESGVALVVSLFGWTVVSGVMAAAVSRVLGYLSSLLVGAVALAMARKRGVDRSLLR